MLSERLKSSTKINHQLLEKKLITIIKNISSHHDYARLVSLFYSYFGALEIGINVHLDHTLLPDYAERRKTASLAADLHQLHAALPAFAGHETLPALHNHLQALGILYVMEGSTLGGSSIVNMVSRQLNTDHLDGQSFFSGYLDHTAKMWHSFKQSIDQPFELGEEDIIIAAANETFLQYARWLERNAN